MHIRKRGSSATLRQNGTASSSLSYIDGLERSDILHTAESLFHDHVPATAHGLATCWIHRRHGQEGFGATMNPGTVPDIGFRFNSMAELAKAHQQEMRDKR